MKKKEKKVLEQNILKAVAIIGVVLLVLTIIAIPRPGNQETTVQGALYSAYNPLSLISFFYNVPIIDPWDPLPPLPPIEEPPEIDIEIWPPAIGFPPVITEDPECEDDDDCEGVDICEAGLCITPMIYIPEDWGPECFLDEDCGDGMYCMAGICEDRDSDPEYPTDPNECYFDEDCGEGETCAGGLCENIDDFYG